MEPGVDERVDEVSRNPRRSFGEVVQSEGGSGHQAESSDDTPLARELKALRLSDLRSNGEQLHAFEDNRRPSVHPEAVIEVIRRIG